MGNYSAYFFYAKCRLKIQYQNPDAVFPQYSQIYCGNTASGLTTYATKAFSFSEASPPLPPGPPDQEAWDTQKMSTGQSAVTLCGWGVNSLHLWSHKSDNCACWLNCTVLFMVALCNRADHYIFALWFLSSFYLSFFIPRLILAAVDWMSTILLHMAWP